MLNLSRNTLRGLTGVAAVTALAAFALPNAQAVPAANPPYPVLPQPRPRTRWSAPRRRAKA